MVDGEDFPITTSLGGGRGGISMSLSKSNSNRELKYEREPSKQAMETTVEVNGKSCLWQAGALGMVPVDYDGPSPQILPFSFTSLCCLLPHPILNPFPPGCLPSCTSGRRFC